MASSTYEPETARPTVGTFEEEVRQSVVTSVLLRHAGLILTVGYAFLAAVGVLYNYFFFHAFGIDILDYSETSDFVVAAIRSPVVILLCVLPAILIRLAVGARRLARRKSPRYHAYALRHEVKYGPQWRVFMSVILPLLFLTYAATFSLDYAKHSSDLLKRGVGTHVRVTRTNAIPGDSATKLMIGSTSKFFFFYDTLTKTTNAIPVDNIAAINVAAPKSRTAK